MAQCVAEALREQFAHAELRAGGVVEAGGGLGGGGGSGGGHGGHFFEAEEEELGAVRGAGEGLARHADDADDGEVVVVGPPIKLEEQRPQRLVQSLRGGERGEGRTVTS